MRRSLRHRATPRFWKRYRDLPVEIRQLADRCYENMLQNPFHPSLHFKKVGEYWSVRVGLHNRAVGIESDDDMVWVWIGTHAEYDALLARR